MKFLPIFCALLLCVAPLHACLVTPEDLENKILPTKETALIVWDAKNRVEHFIREANFSGPPENFGFVVPTPTKPSLVGVEAPFSDVTEQIRPEIRVETHHRFSLLGYMNANIRTNFGVAGRPAADGASFEVVEQTQVGDYDAAILRASDANAMRRWLAKNRFKTSDSSQRWLEFYTAKNWYFTAFKISKERLKFVRNNHLSPVRMSFATDAPFYPYHEPESARKSKDARSLRLFFVGPERVEAQIESPAKKEAWNAKTAFSAPLKNASQLGDDLKLENLGGENSRLTAFEDVSTPRNGFGDLYFSSAASQEEIRPEPVISAKKRVFYWPLDLLFLAAAVVFLKRRAANEALFSFM